MNTQNQHKQGWAMILSLICIALGGCGPRVVISTGTTIGLKATPGDGSTRPPQVSLAYKRTELALVPTGKQKATGNSDAFSTLASIHFFSEWFGDTKIQSLLGTGIAARDIQGPSENDPQTLKMSGEDQSNNSTFWNKYKNITDSTGKADQANGIEKGPD